MSSAVSDRVDVVTDAGNIRVGWNAAATARTAMPDTNVKDFMRGIEV
jgi:hypothetical protein